MSGCNLPKIMTSYNSNNHIIKFADDNDILYDGIIFQSYKTIMMVISYDGVYFNNNIDCYTNTTIKYLYRCLKDVKYCINSVNQNIIDEILVSKNKKQAILNYILDTNKYIND